MISLRNELDIKKCPNEESDLISVRAAITVTIIDGLNHIGCLVLDLILQKRQFYIVLPTVVFLGLFFSSCFHVLFALYICSMVSWAHLVFRFAGCCLFNSMSVSFSVCNVNVQIISFNLTLTPIKEFCGFPFQFIYTFHFITPIFCLFCLFKEAFYWNSCCRELQV